MNILNYFGHSSCAKVKQELTQAVKDDSCDQDQESDDTTHDQRDLQRVTLFILRLSGWIHPLCVVYCTLRPAGELLLLPVRHTAGHMVRAGL